MTPALSRAAARLAVAAAALAIAAGAAEIGLRLAGYRVPRLLAPSIRSTYRLAPGSRFVYRGYLPGNFEDFANLVELNGAGFHDRDYAAERPSPETYRILVLGDSYVAAFEVPLEETFHKRLEARLRADDPLRRGSYEVIAFGQGKSAQAAELHWLREYGPRYRPDLVLLLFFCGNDVMENSRETFGPATRFATFWMREVAPRKAAFFERLLLLPGSRLNGFIAESATTLYALNLHRFHTGLSAEALVSPELGVYRQPLAPEWEKAWSRTRVLLDAIRKESEKLGARFVVASLSGPQAIGDVGLLRTWSDDDPGMDFERPARWIAEWTAAEGVPHLPLGPRLSEAGRHRVFWPHDAHLNPHGHQVVADALYDFLVGLAG